jgi:hypothetical protein
MTTDSDIRAGLHALAERAGAPSLDGDDLADLVVAEETSRRRRTRGLLAVVAAVVVVVTAVPFVLTHGEDRSDVTTPVLRSADIYGVPTRGSLADDAGFVEAARQQTWSVQDLTRGLPGPPVDSHRVVFAGEVGGRSLALVVGESTPLDRGGEPPSDPSLSAAWFVGTAHGIEPYGRPRTIVADEPIGLVGPGGNLVVVAAPGDQVEVSERPEIAADGSRTRRYEATPTRDGIAVHGLERPTSDKRSAVPLWQASSFRVLRDGALVHRTMPDAPIAQDTTAIGLRMRSARLVEDTLDGQDLAIGLLVQLGRTDWEADAVLQWAGPVAGVPRSTAAVVTVTVPSGAVVVGANLQVDSPSGGYIATSCGTEARPAGAPAEDRIYAAACPPLGGTDADGTIVVVAPQQVTTVRVYDERGTFLTELPAADGVVTAPLPRHAFEVEALTGSGVSLGRSSLLAQVNLLGN